MLVWKTPITKEIKKNEWKRGQGQSQGYIFQSKSLNNKTHHIPTHYTLTSAFTQSPYQIDKKATS